MTIANAKKVVVKAVLGVTAMGAILVAGTAKAQAQQFAVGVQFGTPYYSGYNQGRRDFDRDGFRDHERREAYEFARQQEFLRQREFERREAFARHEAWERQEHGYRGGYGDGRNSGGYGGYR